MKEKELNRKIRKDLSRYFEIMPGEKAGRHIITNKLIRPDILCRPGIMTKEYGFTKDFNLELKIIPKQSGQRKALINGFWQAYEQLHLTKYADYNLQFGLVATVESYTGFETKELKDTLYYCLRCFNKKNIGWLDMTKGFPRFWMSRITSYDYDGVKYNASPMWQPAKRLDTKQLIIRNGSKTSREKI